MGEVPHSTSQSTICCGRETRAEESSRLYRHHTQAGELFESAVDAGVFRCSAAAKGTCWYRGYCMRERVYPAVLAAVTDAALSIDGVRGAVLARVQELHEKGGSVAAELKGGGKRRRASEPVRTGN